MGTFSRRTILGSIFLNGNSGVLAAIDPKILMTACSPIRWAFWSITASIKSSTSQDRELSVKSCITTNGRFFRPSRPKRFDNALSSGADTINAHEVGRVAHQGRHANAASPGVFAGFDYGK